MPTKKKSKTRRRAPARTYDARPDTADFRDRIFVPTLVEVPIELPLNLYLKTKPIILDQGTEGACTGFGLAACANHLLRSRKIVPDETPVSPKMLYELAKRYDEWSGEDYERLQCSRCHEGLAQARCVRTGILAKRRRQSIVGQACE